MLLTGFKDDLVKVSNLVIWCMVGCFTRKHLGLCMLDLFSYQEGSSPSTGPVFRTYVSSRDPSCMFCVFLHEQTQLCLELHLILGTHLLKIL